MQETKIIRFKDLKKKIGGISRSTVDRWEAQGNFPKRIHLGENIIGWIEEEINKWIKERIDINNEA